MPWLPVVGALLGAGVGSLVGYGLLRLIRTAAGGHRRFTHSLVLAAALALLAGGLFVTVPGAIWVVPVALAWGIALHVIGDVVTPAGVPLAYPLSSATVRVLPEPLCRMGEPIIGLAALALGMWLLTM
jgi:membrane-bound metal-dependent hydrolase YbcI (DUF457 family)